MSSDIRPSHYVVDLESQTIARAVDGEGSWGLVASTNPKFKMPSIDPSMYNLLKDCEEYDFKYSTCIFCHGFQEYYLHLHDGLSRRENDANSGTSRYIHRPPCSWFDNVNPYPKAYEDIRWFWRDEKPFVLRRFTNKIYEGYQWLNLSQEEKEKMLTFTPIKKRIDLNKYFKKLKPGDKLWSDRDGVLIFEEYTDQKGPFSYISVFTEDGERLTYDAYGCSHFQCETLLRPAQGLDWE